MRAVPADASAEASGVVLGVRLGVGFGVGFGVGRTTFTGARRLFRFLRRLRAVTIVMVEPHPRLAPVRGAG